MPYEFSFTKNVGITDRARYINRCCIGGDVVLEALLPAISQRYGKVDSGEEDWGWYVWSTSQRQRTAVEITTDDDLVGRFRVRIATRTKGRLFGWKEVDTAALEELRQIMNAQLSTWLGQAPLVVHVD
jgi:hypothetical protein